MPAENKIKIGVWILSEYKPQAGGGFSLYDKLIKLIDEYAFPEDLEICFVGHKPASDYSFKKKYYSVYAFPFNVSFITDAVTKYSHKSSFIGKRERNILRKNNVDVIYYPVQGFRKINNFPFISANWDIGHLSSFAFPEFAMNKRFEFREKWYSKEIYKALMVFAESVAGKKELISYTHLNPERIGIIPLIAGGITELEVSEKEMSDCLAKYGLENEKFFFYPAQFWAHKNHHNLLFAFAEFRKEFPEMKLVLTGSDKGNKDYIIQAAKDFGIEKQVVFTGFISDQCLFSFYRKAMALVFPGLLGPTNMPLLEAAMLNCPVLCSDLEGHKECMQDGANYFNPTDANAICESMKFVMNSSNRNILLFRSREVVKDSLFTSEQLLTALTKNFRKVKSIRNSWGVSDKIY